MESRCAFAVDSFLVGTGFIREQDAVRVHLFIVIFKTVVDDKT